MAQGSIYKVALVGEAQFGQVLVNTFHYRALQDTIIDTQAEDLAQAVEANLVTPHANTRSVATGLSLIQVRGITVPTEGFDLLVSPAVSGTVAGDALPPQSAAVITWTTGLVGRRFRGRSFLWPSGEAQQNSGVWAAGYLGVVSDFGDAALEIGDGILTAFYELVVWSGTYSIATKVTGHTARTRVQTQRRRVLGVGA